MNRDQDALEEQRRTGASIYVAFPRANGNPGDYFGGGLHCVEPTASIRSGGSADRADTRVVGAIQRVGESSKPKILRRVLARGLAIQFWSLVNRRIQKMNKTQQQLQK